MLVGVSVAVGPTVPVVPVGVAVRVAPVGVAVRAVPVGVAVRVAMGVVFVAVGTAVGVDTVADSQVPFAVGAVPVQSLSSTHAYASASPPEQNFPVDRQTDPGHWPSFRHEAAL
jgi:hypothetical protein